MTFFLLRKKLKNEVKLKSAHLLSWKAISHACMMGAMTSSKMTFRYQGWPITTIGITTLGSIASLTITALAITRRHDTQHNDIQHNWRFGITMICHYAECRILFMIMLNFIMLSVVMLNVTIATLTIATLTVTTVTITTPSVAALKMAHYNNMLLNITIYVECQYAECHFDECCGAAWQTRMQRILSVIIISYLTKHLSLNIDGASKLFPCF